MAIHRRKEKWDNFAQKLEDLRQEVENTEQETVPLSGKKTRSE